MKSTLANELKFAGELDKLREKGNLFGVGDALVRQVDDYLDDCETKVAYWASDTLNTIAETNVGVPVKTGNLRDSLEIDSDKSPVKTFVGVDLDKLARGFGQDGHGDHDYTEEANEANAAGGGKIKHEFIRAIWFEQGKKNAKKYFGKITAYKKS